MLKKGKKIYLAGLVDKTMQVEVASASGFGGKIEGTVDLEWADGQIGAVAVFSNKKKAKKYSKGSPIVTMQATGELSK